eukprot:CAMPEP_0175042844 /NCGR_PEP_ID=MMETSP0052_2-20121109/2815_1 /TAXON_ID=51329 ORGANISM="Polytomella parva, Strain SAG 63-3" /NCGR_SAMPLE_ID=MMETSP0052_2 /ASSEMBLY_ACC=CAM_ASM_000194 /LENGTH=154 /DNA_ID=CAMNT_0016305753 /DNA_START=99 /DNA_END=563 /DNA_ORIENTATION=-
MATGLKMLEWGVRFSDPGSSLIGSNDDASETSANLPLLLVGDGIDVATTQAWIKDQVPKILDRSNKMLHILDLASSPFPDLGSSESNSAKSREEALTAAAQTAAMNRDLTAERVLDNEADGEGSGEGRMADEKAKAIVEDTESEAAMIVNALQI